LLPGEGEVERPVGGRGAVGREPGGRRADLPTDPPASGGEQVMCSISLKALKYRQHSSQLKTDELLNNNKMSEKLSNHHFILNRIPHLASFTK